MSDDQSSQRAEIMRLHYMEGLSIRAISRHLQVSRKTVRRSLGKLPLRPVGDKARRASLLDHHERQIQDWLLATPELRATQILERLRQRGYTGGISILRQLVRKLRPAPDTKVYLTVKHKPAGTMQVDWGDFGFACRAFRVASVSSLRCFRTRAASISDFASVRQQDLSCGAWTTPSSSSAEAPMPMCSTT